MIYTEIVKMGDDYGAMKKWSHHQDRFHKLLSSGFLSDLEIKVKSKVFRAHKLIIATGSPFLYEEICQASSSSKFVVKDDVDPDTFDAFLKFLYTGVASDVSVEQALPLLQLAVAYKVFDLEAKCHSLLNEDLTDEIAIQIYQQAVHYKDQDLLEKSLRYVCRNAWSIIDSKEFTSLKFDNLKRLLLSEKLLVLNETQLIHGLFRWAKKECERKNEKNASIVGVIKDLSRWINWDRVDPDKFEEPDVIELEKLFNAYYTMDDDDMMNPKRQCKVNRRKYFDDDDSSYLMSRFPQKFAYCTDNKASSPAEVFKFKTNVSIILLSIGIPAYSQNQSCQDFFNVKLEIMENDDDETKTVLTDKIPHSTEIYHLRFPKPLKIKKNTWYSVSGSISGTPGYGNIGGKSLYHLKCRDSETIVKFEFKAAGSSSSIEDILGGQIDEFNFKLVEN